MLHKEVAVAWERRAGAGPFYYRAKRTDGKVVKEYFGRGEKAQQAAREDVERRAARAAKRQAVHDEMRKIQPAVALTSNVATDANLLLEAIFLAAGLRRRNYGRWRLQRGG
jgi:hypothetical protein